MMRSEASVASAHAGAHDHQRVLILENDFILATELMESVLAEDMTLCTFSEVNSEDAAISLVQTSSPDIIIVSYKFMCELGTRRLIEHYAKHTPMIFILPEYCDYSLVRRLEDLGVVHFVAGHDVEQISVRLRYMRVSTSDVL